MLKTTAMRLAELMILREDINSVLEYLGKKGNFEIHHPDFVQGATATDETSAILERLKTARAALGIPDRIEYSKNISLPTAEDMKNVKVFLTSFDELQEKETRVLDKQKQYNDTLQEARAFANLKVPYSELEHLSFLTMRIGKIDPSVLPDIKSQLGGRVVIVPLGNDSSRILAAASKKGRFALDTELSKFGFVPIEVSKDFKGIPDELLVSLENQVREGEQAVKEVQKEKETFVKFNSETLLDYLQMFTMAHTVEEVRDNLESTRLVYRLTGWIAEKDSSTLMKELDDLTEGRIAIRIYEPEEVPSVVKGEEKVPVKVTHGKFVSSFERLIFSYGAPLYGSIDPTPMVAVFFTILFGIMFGDAGQGLVFVLIGILLTAKKLKAFHTWWKFGPIFISIGCSSFIMGLLTGEFFTNSELLVPFSRFVTGLFGEPKDHILHLMPESGATAKLLMFFGFTLAVGFIINSVGLIINIINQFTLGHPGKAIFSKTGIFGTCFFWYAVFMAIRIAFFKSSFFWFDGAILGFFLFGVFLSEPMTRLVEGHRPVFENGFFAAIIEGIVEVLEVVSTYISNSVSFVRVGAFALSHAVLSYIIFMLTDMVGGSFSVGGLAVTILGNAVIIILEGMIVAIQVIRLQYYEFFSKFFTETGKEFKPFKLNYKE